MPDPTQIGRRAGAFRAAAAVALVAGAAALCCFTIDVPAAAWAKAHCDGAPALIKSVLTAARVFGQFFSVAFAACLILVLDPKRRRDGGLFILTIIVATLAVHLTKGVAGRVRPWRYLREMEALGASFALQRPPMWHLFGGFARGYDSFPSAHAAAAFAMAGVLLRMYRRAGWIFLATAALCAVSRIADNQHYPSDTIVAAAIGLWIGLGTSHWRWSAWTADWIESHQRPQRQQPQGLARTPPS